MRRNLCILLSIAAPVFALLLVATGSAQADAGASSLLQAGAPAVVSYQGQVMVGGDPYTGTGYFKFAVVSAGGGATFWSNDGTSTAGGEPTNAVSLNVSDGLFDVLLGDTSLGGGMTQALSPSVFDGTDRCLRVWFSDDDVTFTLLSPDRRIAAVPYALQAEEVRNAWRLTGNAGTVPGTDFLGTTDATSLTLAVGGAPALRLEPFAGGTPNILAGHEGNYVVGGVQGAVIAGGGGIGSGWANRVTDNFGVVAGGRNNQAGSDDGTLTNGEFAVVSGGRANTASGEEALVGGGWNNLAGGERAFIGGGSGNVVTTTAGHGVVVGGLDNEASGNVCFVGGGESNTAAGNRSFIGGGMLNVTQPMTAYAAIVGGRSNTAGGQFSFIGNGYLNEALGFRSAIVGGEQNATHDWFGFIANGDSNEVWGDYSSIGGGYGNVITGTMAVIGGGGYHVADGARTTIAGGQGNTASENYATVPGGFNAAATHYGEMAYASGRFDERGDAQTSTYVLRRTSSGTTQTQLFLNPGSNARITLPVSRTMTFDILVVAAADNGDAASYQYAGGIKHTSAGGTALIGSVQELMALEDDSSWSVDIDADTSNDALRIRVAGSAGRTVRWVATVRTAETVMP
jgi:hypothetical protein